MWGRGDVVIIDIYIHYTMHTRFQRNNVKKFHDLQCLLWALGPPVLHAGGLNPHIIVFHGFEAKRPFP